MTSFYELSSVVRGLFCTWALFICIGFLICTLYAASRKQPFYAVGSLVGFFGAYVIFHIGIEVAEHYRFGFSMVPIARQISALWYGWDVLALSVMTGLCAWWIVRIVRFMQTHLTPHSVKAAADDLPVGFVYYHDDGQTYLMNNKMSELSFNLFGHALMNGTMFADEVGNRRIIGAKDGRVYRFRKRELPIKGTVIHEMVAEDVTEQYRKTEVLREDNERLRAQNERMQAYGEQIDDTVRREEILKAKVHIHDEMNRLLLSIDNAIRHRSKEDQNYVLGELQKNVLLLCMEADTERDNPLSDLEELARHIGVTLHLDTLPDWLTESDLRLFVLAAEECMVNAVKHAEAEHFTVTIRETEKAFTADFTNDGAVPTGPITEGGGISAVRSTAASIGGTVTVQSAPIFRLQITIPKGERTREI